ncbi:MAG: transposase [Thermodesulfobacteriota bacterium]
MNVHQAGRHEFIRAEKHKTLIIKDYRYRKIELKRFYVTGLLYFITSVVENREPISINENCVQILLRVLSQYAKNYYIEIIAFVVLPDHLHLLISPKSQNHTISDFMKSVKGKTAIEINRALRRKGRLWQHQFLDHIVRSKEDYRSHIEYIHYNPIKHGLCDKPEDYRWSSYRFYDLDEDVWVLINKMPL